MAISEIGFEHGLKGSKLVLSKWFISSTCCTELRYRCVTRCSVLMWKKYIRSKINFKFQHFICFSTSTFLAQSFTRNSIERVVWYVYKLVIWHERVYNLHCIERLYWIQKLVLLIKNLFCISVEILHDRYGYSWLRLLQQALGPTTWHGIENSFDTVY